jgi:hypothetical protein
MVGATLVAADRVLLCTFPLTVAGDQGLVRPQLTPGVPLLMHSFPMLLLPPQEEAPKL